MFTHCFAAIGRSSRDAAGSSSNEYMTTGEKEWCRLDAATISGCGKVRRRPSVIKASQHQSRRIR